MTWGIQGDGSKVLIHLSLGNKESYEDWLDHFRDLVRRGLPTPLTVTTDGAPGLIKAVEAIWPEAERIRCWVHKMRNVLDKVPEEAMRSFEEDLEASLAHLKLPAVHRKHVRTTDLIERSFEEERRRAKVIPRFRTKKECLKPVFATLWQASERWRRIRFSEHEQKQLQRYRQERQSRRQKPNQEERTATVA